VAPQTITTLITGSELVEDAGLRHGMEDAGQRFHLHPDVLAHQPPVRDPFDAIHGLRMLGEVSAHRTRDLVVRSSISHVHHSLARIGPVRGRVRSPWRQDLDQRQDKHWGGTPPLPA
jgi:hypothetical protein